MIEYVVIEYGSRCHVCKAVLSDIIEILKKHGVVYVLKLIGDEYYSTSEGHADQPTIESIIQNVQNIKDPETREFILKGDPIQLTRLAILLRSVIQTPRIYIYLKNGKKIVINGAVPKKQWLEEFDKFIELLNNLENVNILL